MNPALRPSTVRELIEQQAVLRPDAVYALATESNEQLNYRSLHAGCARVAALLVAHGCAPGATVSLVMPNGLGTLQWLLGALHGGWCVNPVNLLSQPEQMRYVLEHSDSTLILASPEWADPVRALSPRAKVYVVDAVSAALPPMCPDAPAATPIATTFNTPFNTPISTPAPSPDAVALLMYTSGTTGRPKGVMLTQANLVANACAITAEHALSPADRVLGVLPLHHINAFAVTMLATLASGGSVAMAPRFSAARFWAQALAARCTWLNLVPTMVSYLIEGQGAAPQREALHGIRLARSASAALPPEHLLAFDQRFGIGIVETMGLTETVAPVFSNPLDPALRKLGSVGRASGCEARVIGPDGQTSPDGDTGEITIRGPNVMRGYYKDAEATAAAFTTDGWLRTGDLGHRDSDGFFFVTGRIKELIIKGGENIAPREIDEVLLRHPAVLEAAAVGMPDKHYGQDILACVVLRPGVDAATAEAALRAFCEQHLGRYKTPKLIRFVTELPRGPSGKVQRLKLLDAAG